MIPAPGTQKPIPYLAPHDERKLYTSALSLFALVRSSTSPDSAAIRWSQWSVEGTATFGRPDEMNWSTAICAVASCIATRSGRSLR